MEANIWIFTNASGGVVDPMVDGLDGYPGIVPGIKLAGWVDRLSQNATEPGRRLELSRVL